MYYAIPMLNVHLCNGLHHNSEHNNTMQMHEHCYHVWDYLSNNNIDKNGESRRIGIPPHITHPKPINCQLHTHWYTSSNIFIKLQEKWHVFWMDMKAIMVFRPLLCTCAKLGQADAGDNEAKLMTKLAPEWVRTNDPVIRSPAGYRWATAPAHVFLGWRYSDIITRNIPTSFLPALDVAPFIDIQNKKPCRWLLDRCWGLPTCIMRNIYHISLNLSYSIMDTRVTLYAIFTSPPIGGGRGIVMPMSVCVFVRVCLSVFSQNFKV